MIGKNIDKILNNNIEILRIYNGGGVIWQKPYIWKKFEMIKNYNIIYRQGDLIKNDVNVSVHNISKTSIFPDGNTSSGYNIGIYTRVFVENINTQYIYTSNKPTRFIAYLKRVSEIDSYSVLYKADIYQVIEDKVISGYSKGKYVTEVTSTNIDEYPKNGEKNGYWYELIQ